MHEWMPEERKRGEERMGRRRRLKEGKRRKQRCGVWGTEGKRLRPLV